MNNEITGLDYFLGFDIGGTKCSIVLGDDKFNLYEKIVFETRVERGHSKIIAEFKDKAHELLNKYPDIDLKSIGISCGGPLDSKKGVIYSPPNLPGWDAVPITDIFKKEFGIDVFLQNDANACALAEWLMGAGKGTQNMIFLTFGTGLGAGLIINGNLYSGTNDLAGEVGHVRLKDKGPVGFGKAGSFEGFCSGSGIAQLAQMIVREKLEQGETVQFYEKLQPGTPVSARLVAQAASEGDETAIEIMEVSAQKLGEGLSILVDILNPECVVIGSIYSRNEDFFKAYVDKVLKKEAIADAVKVCKIKAAALGESIGDYAALCVAINNKRF
ncbi:MAG: ROK family protein [Bacteroidota bacterium]|nr:ROK family protein [Bacteroidota bacterium]MDP4206649.1 ROK family protein [Bacteroidota bacterium]